MTFNTPQRLKLGKTHGVDGLPSTLYKKVNVDALITLAQFFNEVQKNVNQPHELACTKVSVIKKDLKTMNTSPD